jgi:hypothetical protein
MLFGVHASLVRRDAPEPLMMAIRFFSFASWDTLSAIDELIRLAIMSTLSTSNHLRANAEAASGLF